MIIDSKLLELVATALKSDPSLLTEDSGLGKHQKWDSLGHISIMSALEAKYGITVNSKNVGELTSLRKIQEYLEIKDKE